MKYFHLQRGITDLMMKNKCIDLREIYFYVCKMYLGDAANGNFCLPDF
jgi:hypothetical protein